MFVPSKKCISLSVKNGLAYCEMSFIKCPLKLSMVPGRELLFRWPLALRHTCPNQLVAHRKIDDYDKMTYGINYGTDHFSQFGLHEKPMLSCNVTILNSETFQYIVA